MSNQDYYGGGGSYGQQPPQGYGQPPYPHSPQPQHQQPYGQYPPQQGYPQQVSVLILFSKLKY